MIQKGMFPKQDLKERMFAKAITGLLWFLIIATIFLFCCTVIWGFNEATNHNKHVALINSKCELYCNQYKVLVCQDVGDINSANTYKAIVVCGDKSYHEISSEDK